MNVHNRTSFKHYFRMDFQTFQDICSSLSDSLSRNQMSLRQDVLSVEEKVALTLRFLATGDSYSSLQLTFLIESSTICKVVVQVCDAIRTNLGPLHLKPPRTREEWLLISDRFMNQWQFPHTLGSVDGKHIEINKPQRAGSQYWCYKGFNSIVLLGVADADYKFLWAECGCNGVISDGGVFDRSVFKQMLVTGQLNVPRDEQFPYYFLGDDAFPLSTSLLKPFK